MTEHTNKQFDADLQRIRTELLQMGGREGSDGWRPGLG